MARAVKAQRRYDGTGRRQQAQQTRGRVLAAARALFLVDGYAGTTLPAVADRAGVSVETIYKAFGNKPGLAKAVFDVAIAGDDEPIPIMQREFVRSNMAEPDPRQKLIAYGRHVADVAPRISPILLVLRQAAGTDDGARGVWETTQHERLTGMTAFAQHLDGLGHLRPDVTMEEARDVLWTFNSPELWDLLVRQREWSLERYGAFIGAQLVSALLPAR